MVQSWKVAGAKARYFWSYSFIRDEKFRNRSKKTRLMETGNPASQYCPMGEQEQDFNENGGLFNFHVSSGRDGCDASNSIRCFVTICFLS
jgi:hypothetical protein